MPTSTSQDYALQAVKGIREVFDNAVQYDLNVFRDQNIIEFYSTDEFNEIFTSTEGLTGVKELAEAEAPPTLALEDGYSITLSEARFGGALQLTTTQMRQSRDNTTKIDIFLARQQAQLLQTTRDFMLRFAFYPLNNAVNASALTLAPDGAPLLGTHSWATPGADTWSNLSSSTSVTEAAIDAAMIYAGDFKDPSGKPMPLNFDTIIVKKGSNNARAAKRLFASGISPVAIDDVNVYYGEMTVIETPYIVAQSSWFLRDSSLPNSLRLGIGQQPAIGDYIPQNNGSMRWNVEGFMKNGVFNMPFDWYGYSAT